METHNFKTFFASAAVTAMVLSVPVSAKAKKGSITKVAVTNLPSSTLTLKKGKKKTLKFKVTKKGKISKALAYKSSNKKIVTVSKKGVVKAKKKGKATVTAYAKANKKKKVAIQVIVGTPVTKIKLNKTKATLTVKKTLKLKATVTPKKASYKKVLWKTSNKKIATVSSAGKVTAKKKGTAKITATAADGSGKKATAKITVKAAAKKKTVTPTPTPTPAPAVVPTTVASLQVKDPRTVTFTLTKAQALTTDNVKLEAKTTEAANYRKTLKIKSMTTTDNVNYSVTLKKESAVGNDAADHNVRLTVTGLENNSAPVTIETLFRKGKITRTDTNTMFVKRGTRLDFQASLSTDPADTYSIVGLPAGLKQDPNKDGVYVYGVPTTQSDQEVTVRETDVYGNTFTKVTYLKYYDEDHVNAYATFNYSSDSGYFVPTVDTNGTYDNLADDSLVTYVNAKINVAGGQTYEEGHYEKTGNKVTDYGNILGYKEDVIVSKKKEAPKDTTEDQKDTSDQTTTTDQKDTSDQTTTTDQKDTSDQTQEDAYDVVYGDEADKAYKLDDQGNKIVKKDESGNIIYAKDAFGEYIYDEDGKQLPEYELNDGYKVEYSNLEYSYNRVYGEKDEEKWVSYEETHYEFVNSNTEGLTLSDDGYISGKLSGSRTVTVRVSKKDKAGNVISVDVPVSFNVADAKLVKGTVTDSNGKGVQGAIVSAIDNDYNTKFDSSISAYANTNGQYDYALINGDNYDVTVSRNASDNFYASQTTADTMNYKLDGVQYNVAVNDQSGLNTAASGNYYDNDTNDRYFLYDNYNYTTNTHNATIFADKPTLTLVSDDDNVSGTLTIANGAASVTITKK
ncbi:Ig-like domain-containing protein [Intestinibaculum porci]|nr:Ig-like domain-containing protein [Intestinibaculum porci]